MKHYAKYAKTDTTTDYEMQSNNYIFVACTKPHTELG